MRATLSIGSLAGLAALLLSAAPAAAGDPTAPTGYPMWVTNDYNCVIECMKVFDATVKEKPNKELEKSSMQCVTDKCNKDSMALNLYQWQYITQMFYSTGSIYESEGMKQPQQAAAPPPNPSSTLPAAFNNSTQTGAGTAAKTLTSTSAAIKTAAAANSTASGTGTAANGTASSAATPGLAVGELSFTAVIMALGMGWLL